MLICSSPWLFAACRVLLRQSVPWHPPCALLRLILRSLQIVCQFFVSAALLRPLRRLRPILDLWPASSRAQGSPSLTLRLPPALDSAVPRFFLCSFQGACGLRPLPFAAALSIPSVRPSNGLPPAPCAFAHGSESSLFANPQNDTEMRLDPFRFRFSGSSVSI